MHTKNRTTLPHKALYAIVLLAIYFSAFGSANVYSVRAQQPTSHTITYFQGNKPGALSFTFDDGYTTQVSVGVAFLNARGWKGTFFVITDPDWINGHVSWSTWRTVAAQGHKIESHTVTHQDLTTLTDDQVQYELSQSQIDINQNVPGQSAIALAYPNTSSNSTVQAIAAEYYVAARGGYADEGAYLNYYQTGQDQFGSWSPVNFYDVGSMSGDGIDSSNLSFQNNLNLATLRHGWLDIHFHKIDDATPFGSVLDYIQGIQQNYWIDTFSNIARYMKERMNSTVQVITDTSSEIRLQIVMDASLPTSIYNVPLTMRSTVPSSWTQVYVQQGNSIQTFTPVIEGSDSVIYYNAIPNGGDIILTPPNPIPGLTSLNPTSVFAGGSDFTLTVNGTNFISSSVVRWNNSDRPTTYVSGTQLTATISASDISTVGTANITVFNPSPGGGVSNSLTFTINPPPPGDFGKTTPSNGAINQSLNTSLSWGTSTGAGSYEYCYDTSNDNACSNWISNGSSTSVLLSGLSPATTYYWQVRAVNSSGTTYADGSSTSFWSFATVPNPPTSFNKSNPLDGDVNQPLSLSLSWNSSS
ncbi:MAG TPA: polysaccharide deacetylase family protein, partial [Anaerolineales bacterium]|nr:polysaccharide deacetylase family protein [Anaerolineales bacterium]